MSPVLFPSSWMKEGLDTPSLNFALPGALEGDYFFSLSAVAGLLSEGSLSREAAVLTSLTGAGAAFLAGGGGSSPLALSRRGVTVFLAESFSVAFTTVWNPRCFRKPRMASKRLP